MTFLHPTDATCEAIAVYLDQSILKADLATGPKLFVARFSGSRRWLLLDGVSAALVLRRKIQHEIRRYHTSSPGYRKNDLLFPNSATLRN